MAPCRACVGSLIHHGWLHLSSGVQDPLAQGLRGRNQVTGSWVKQHTTSGTVLSLWLLIESVVITLYVEPATYGQATTRLSRHGWLGTTLRLARQANQSLRPWT